MYVALALAAIVAAALLIFYAFMARSAQLLEVKSTSKPKIKAIVPQLGLAPVATGTMALGVSAIIYLIAHMTSH